MPLATPFPPQLKLLPQQLPLQFHSPRRLIHGEHLVTIHIEQPLHPGLDSARPNLRLTELPVNFIRGKRKYWAPRTLLSTSTRYTVAVVYYRDITAEIDMRVAPYPLNLPGS